MDGTQLRLRAASPHDARLLEDLLCGLSPASGFHRFLSGLGRPAPRLIRGLLATDERRGAWLALGPGGEAVGHACWSVNDRGTVDVGVLVADAWQRRGVGRRLLTAAVLAATAAGATRLHLDAHPDNRVVVRILRERLPRGAVRYADGLVQADVPVAAVLASVPAGFGGVPGEFGAGQRHPVHLVGTVGQP